MRLSIAIPADLIPYMEASARLRNTSVTRMMTRVVHTILYDQMILATLDDNNAVVAVQPTTHVEKVRVERRKEKKEAAAAVVEHRKTRFNPPIHTLRRRSANERTRAEMQADLQRAVLNTGGELVDGDAS